MQDLLLVITNPKKLFEQIAEDHELLKPMLVILVVVALATTAGQFTMDRVSMVEEQFTAQEQLLKNLGTPEEEIKAALDVARAAVEGGPGVMELVSSFIFVPIAAFIGILLWAVYFKIVAGILKVGGSFSDWHAFVWWTRVPMAIGAIIVLLGNLFLSPSSVAEANFLSFATLFGIEVNPMLGQLVYSFDLISIWLIGVTAIGFSAWTEKSIGVSLVIAAIPPVIFFALGLFLNSLLSSSI
ncbi:MAG: YIP1 family protein [Gammaproteobacteria bacterium]|nr:YIP1 family protein [Gammaproteobacteria bacterium]